MLPLSRYRIGGRSPRTLIATLVIGVAFAAVSATAFAGAATTPPFKYAFRITALDVTATLTFGKAKTTVRLSLTGPSNKKWLSWFGEGKASRGGIFNTSSTLYVRGSAAYSSADPTCAQTIEYKSTRSRDVRGDLWIGQKRVNGPFGLYVAVRDFPLAAPVPGQDAQDPDAGTERCGKPQVRWYDSAEGGLPLTVMTKPSFTFVGHRQERFEDPGVDSIEWTVKMTVKRLLYHRIDCAREPEC